MKRYSGRKLFILSHFTILILAFAVFVGISYQIRVYVTDEMADKQALVMQQAMNGVDMEIESAIHKAVDISQDEYVQWFYYVEEPFDGEDLFNAMKLVEHLGEFYTEDPFIEDYYVYFGRSGRIANANSLYRKEQFYNLVWSYSQLTQEEWEELVLEETESGVVLGEQMMQKDSTRKELLTYIYQLQKTDKGDHAQVVLLLDKEQIDNYLNIGLKYGAVKITDSQGRLILYSENEELPKEELPAHLQEGWKIMEVEGEEILVNSVYSENTGWVYTSYLPMKYVLEDAQWLNGLILTGVALLLILGIPLCFYWAGRSYVPIRNLIRIFSEAGYGMEESKGDEMDYLEQSLCLVLERQKDLETSYQKALADYKSLEKDLESGSGWNSYRKGGIKFSIKEKRKLVNFIQTGDQQGWQTVVREIYQENGCASSSRKEVHRLFLFVVDMVLLTLDDGGADISRAFEGQQGLLKRLLDSENLQELEEAMDGIFGHISYLIHEEKLDTKERVAERAVEYMNAHYHENSFGLSSMAEAMHISPEHLSRVIKNVTGKNYMEILNNIRLEQAKVYLSTTDMKLDEIAEKVGWGNARNFIRIFKQYEGITPGKYRQK